MIPECKKVNMTPKITRAEKDAKNVELIHELAKMPKQRGIFEERGKIPYFKRIKIEELVNECKAALTADKYLYIADMSGRLTTFFTY